MLDLDSVARYLVFFFIMNLFINLYKAAKVMKILKKLEIRRIPMTRSLICIILWTSPLMKSGNVLQRIDRFIGRNHFTVKGI